MEELLAAADRNMSAAWAAMLPGRAAAPGAIVLTSPLPIALFNPAFVWSEPADANACVRGVLASHDNPLVVYSRSGAVADACLRAGLVEWFQPPLMVLDAPPASWPLPDGVTIEVVADDDAAWRATIAEGFGMPLDATALLDGEGITRYLARLDGEPVATSAAFESDGLRGVYSVATLEQARGRGIGGAVTLAAAAGTAPAVLQSSGEGVAAYERIGFRIADRYRQLERGG